MVAPILLIFLRINEHTGQYIGAAKCTVADPTKIWSTRPTLQHPRVMMVTIMMMLMMTLDPCSRMYINK